MFAYDKMEENIIFKSYLRRLLQDLTNLKQALNDKDYSKAKEITSNLIDDTQQGIEDN